jgi:hypothetical protein
MQLASFIFKEFLKNYYFQHVYVFIDFLEIFFMIVISIKDVELAIKVAQKIGHAGLFEYGVKAALDMDPQKASRLLTEGNDINRIIHMKIVEKMLDLVITSNVTKREIVRGRGIEGVFKNIRDSKKEILIPSDVISKFAEIMQIQSIKYSYLSQTDKDRIIEEIKKLFDSHNALAKRGAWRLGAALRAARVALTLKIRRVHPSLARRAAVGS